MLHRESRTSFSGTVVHRAGLSKMIVVIDWLLAAGCHEVNVVNE